MYKLNFKPFVGENYLKQDFKILLLGESHYCTEGDCCCFKTTEATTCNRGQDFTRTVIYDRYLGYKKGLGVVSQRWMSTYTKFSNSYEEKKLSNTETVDFWNKVAFYNYVQVPMQRPRQSPSFDDFKNSQSALKGVLSELNPDLIIIWGYRLWNNFPKQLKHTEDDFPGMNFCNLEKKYPLFVIPHPSAPVSNVGFSKIISDYIDKVKVLDLK